MPEFSNQFEVIEIFRPNPDGGFTAEQIFYDPEAFVQPLRQTTRWVLSVPATDPEMRFVLKECRTQSTIVNGPDGRPVQLIPGDPGYIDYFGRPWAQNWEEHFEKGLEKPRN
jgi:hypothetical protein